MKNLTKTTLSILFVVSIIFPAIAMASGQHTVVGTIKNYRVIEYQSGTAILMIEMSETSNTYGTVPACSTNDTRFVIALDSPMIDQVTSIVMTAHISRLTVALKSPLLDERQQCHGQTQRLAHINVKEL